MVRTPLGGRAVEERAKPGGVRNWFRVVVHAPSLVLALIWHALADWAWRTALILGAGGACLFVFYVALHNGSLQIALASTWRLLNATVVGDYLSLGALGTAAVYAVCRVNQLNHDLSLRRPTWPTGVFDAWWGRHWSMVLGVGGTGKSTLLQNLETEQSASDAKRFIFARELAHIFASLVRLGPRWGGDPREYERTEFPKPVKVGHRKYLYDMPGQNSELGAWDERIDSLSDANRSLIVFLSTYGYSAEIRKRPAAYFEGFADLNAAIDRFRADVLEREYNAMERLVSTIEARWPAVAARKLTFVHIVNMAGFWWPQREEVKLRYLSGRYKDLEIRLRKKIGSRLQYYGFVPASFLFGDLPHESIIRDGRPLPLYRADFDNKDEILRLNAPMLKILIRELFRTQWPRGGSK